MTDRAKRERDARLATLLEHPYWKDLQEAFVERKEELTKVTAASLLGGEPVDQREIDKRRGFLLGAAWVLATPAMSKRSMEAALKKQPEQETDG